MARQAGACHQAGGEGPSASNILTWSEARRAVFLRHWAILVKRWTLATLMALLGASLLLAVQVSARAGAPVYVTLWFDTEDYLLPQDDDATKRLAELLTRLGVRATFKIVGESARARAAWAARCHRGVEAARHRLSLEHAQPAADDRGVSPERRLGGGPCRVHAP